MESAWHRSSKQKNTTLPKDNSAGTWHSFFLHQKSQAREAAVTLAGMVALMGFATPETYDVKVSNVSNERFSPVATMQRLHSSGGIGNYVLESLGFL